jgi:phosphoserine phosphatase RsbU/P
VAYDGLQAWEAIEHDPAIGLAVLDWGMPTLDGVEVCRRVRASARHSHLHVLLLTARESRADLVEALQAGADDFLSKPFDPEILRARINVGLRVLSLRAALADRVAELESALSRVKELHGLLPICSYCKHVRTDGNAWEQVEHYVAQHSNLQFSHGICPGCYARVMGELDGSKGEG